MTSGQNLVTSGQKPATSGQQPATSGQNPVTSGTNPVTSGRRSIFRNNIAHKTRYIGTAPRYIGPGPRYIGTRPRYIGTGPRYIEAGNVTWGRALLHRVVTRCIGASSSFLFGGAAVQRNIGRIQTDRENRLPGTAPIALRRGHCACRRQSAWSGFSFPPAFFFAPPPVRGIMTSGVRGRAP